MNSTLDKLDKLNDKTLENLAGSAGSEPRNITIRNTNQDTQSGETSQAKDYSSLTKKKDKTRNNTLEECGYSRKVMTRTSVDGFK